MQEHLRAGQLAHDIRRAAVGLAERIGALQRQIQSQDVDVWLAEEAQALLDDDLALRARALRAVGELGDGIRWLGALFDPALEDVLLLGRKLELAGWRRRQ